MEIDQRLRDQTHPNPPPSSYRKIELQSPQDLTFLQDNLANVALEKLNFVLPDNPSRSKPATVISLGGNSRATEEDHDTNTIENDPLKEQVRALISDFLRNTWHSAQENLTLNGLDATNVPIPARATLSPTPTHASSDTTRKSPSETTQATISEEREGVHFTYAPFDPRLQHKLASLHGELEKLTAEVSNLRRAAPKKAASMYESTLDTQISTDEENYINSRDQDTALAVDGLHLDPVRTGWSADVKEKFTGAARELGGLSGVPSTDTIPSNTVSAVSHKESKKEPSLTETMGKVIRARDVVLEME